MKKKPEGRVEKAKGLKVSAGPVGNVRNFPIHPRRLATCPRDAEALGDQFFGSGRGCAPGPGGERRRPPSTALVAGDSELCSRARPAPSARARLVTLGRGRAPEGALVEALRPPRRPPPRPQIHFQHLEPPLRATAGHSVSENPPRAQRLWT